MPKMLILAAQNNVSDARMEYLIRDRPSWLRFLGFDLGAAKPDSNTIRLFRKKLTEVGAHDAVFTDFDRQLKERGYLAMAGQIVDATLVTAPKQRNSISKLFEDRGALRPAVQNCSVVRSKTSPGRIRARQSPQWMSP